MQIILDDKDITPELIAVLFKTTKAEPVKAEPTKKPKTTKAEPVKLEPITAETVKAEAKTEPVKPEPVTAAETREYTLNDLKKSAADLIASGKVQIKTLQELNEKFKIRSLTELKLDQINDYAADLIGLGASL